MVLVETVHAGTLEGTVRYRGEPPKPTLMKVAKDQEQCGDEVSIQTIHIHNAKGVLSDVVVSVKSLSKALEDKKIQRPVINMKCAFAPRISLARLGQEIEVRNQDPILHNTHIKLGKRTFLNVAQIPGGRPIVKSFKRQGVYTVRCDKHVFMEAYLHVFAHPFHALTNQTGTFRIADIPPGKHPIRVWHETLGILDKIVNIPEKGTVRFDFIYP